MTDAYRLDCESAEADCRFVIQSEDRAEAVDLAGTHMRESHGKDYSDDELRNEHLQTV
jgi:predicted small metal-binding protein